MKSYFIVGAKLLGIYLCYLCIVSLFHTISTLIVFQSNSSEAFSLLTIVSSIGTLIILLISSGVLLFKTEKLSSLLKINDDQSIQNQRNSLQTGIILIGLYVFSTNIGRFLATVYIQIQEANAGMSELGAMPKGPALSQDLLTISITIAFSLILIFGSNTIEKLIIKPIQKQI